MVSVDPDKPIPTLAPVARGRSAASTEKFDSILHHLVDSTPARPAEARPTYPVSDIRPARFAEAVNASRVNVVDQIGRLLDTMDTYRRKLIENGSTLRQIEPLVKRMASESESLRVMSEALEDRERLKDIAGQSLVISSIEIARFSGGHYNGG